jgi:DNA-directed RNA polymerase specialized sigma24 family protein
MTPQEERAALLRLDDDEADDLLQVAILRLSRHWHRHLDAPDAYVRTVLANLAKDRARRRHLVAQQLGIRTLRRSTPR